MFVSYIASDGASTSCSGSPTWTSEWEARDRIERKGKPDFTCTHNLVSDLLIFIARVVEKSEARTREHWGWTVRGPTATCTAADVHRERTGLSQPSGVMVTYFHRLLGVLLQDTHSTVAQLRKQKEETLEQVRDTYQSMQAQVKNQEQQSE